MVLVGVDEAGRGPLAGPVVAVAVGWHVAPDVYLNDSKKMTPQARERSFECLLPQVYWSVGTASAQEIDAYNIRQATLMAMERALNLFPSAIETIIVDGLDVPLAYADKAEARVKADQTVAQVSAASIIAKVYRDRLMCALATCVQKYGFEQHKGYPTAMHKTRVKAEGLSPWHRSTFCKWL